MNTTVGNTMLNPDVREVIRSLNDNRVRYLIVGGYAVAFRGFIDLENLRRNKKAPGRTQDLADLENLK